MSQQAQNDYYPDREAAAFGYAAAVNEEVRDLFEAGADIVQLDEPYLQARPERRAPTGSRCEPGAGGHHGDDRRACLLRVRGHHITTPEATRSCPSWPAARCDQVSIETAQAGLDCSVAGRAGRQDDHPGRAEPERRGRGNPGQIGRPGPARPAVRPAERLVLAPDCGMKYLPRDAAYGKLAAMAPGGCGVRGRGIGSAKRCWAAGREPRRP